MNQSTLSILDYRQEYQLAFEQLNRQWIEKHFRLEAIDKFVLQEPEKAILWRGGAILIALQAGAVAGVVALKKSAPGILELTKMAVAEAYRGKGIGEKLCLAAIAKARALRASQIILYSHSSLKPAIRLYRRLGFQETALEPGVYERSDLKMALSLDGLRVLRATEHFAAAIASIGQTASKDAFGHLFQQPADLASYLERSFAVEKIAAGIQHPAQAFFVCLQGDQPVGFAQLAHRSLQQQLPSERLGELQKLYVLKSHQGTGAGPALLQAAIEEAKTQQPEFLWLDVLRQNDRARIFYERYGFVRQDQHTYVIGTQPFSFDLMVLALHAKTQVPTVSLTSQTYETP